MFRWISIKLFCGTMEGIIWNKINCDGSGLDGDIASNAKSTCFLCFGRKDNFDKDDVFKRERNISLLSICRYLRINLKEFVTCTTANIPNICVEVCNECSLIVQDLSEFCEELEILQMKVDYTLGKFTRVLEHSNKDIWNDGIDEQTVKKLRQEMIQKCTMRLNASQPKVTLSTAAVLHSGTPPFEPQLVAPEYTCHLCNCKFQLESDYLQHTQVDCPFLPHPPTSLPRPSTSTPTTNQPTFTYIKNGRKFVTCTLCTPHCPVPVTNFRRHNMYKHLDTFFTCHKLPGVTQPDFKIYVDHVIKIEVLSSEKSQVGLDSNPSCKCPHCPSRYTSSYSLYHHLFSVHKKILAEKLVKLQQTTTVNEIKEVNLPGYSQNTHWTCKDCGTSFAHGSSLYKHRNGQCKKFKPDGVKSRKPNFSSRTKAKPEMYYICQLCDKPRRIKNDLKYPHELHFHMETILAADRMPGISWNDFKQCCDNLFQEAILASGTGLGGNGSCLFKCPYCTSTYTDERPLRRHMVSQHRPVISGKLVNLQQKCSQVQKMEPGNDDGPEENMEEMCEMSFGEVAIDGSEMCIGEQDDPLKI